MKVPTWMFVVVAIIAAIFIWRRTQEGLRPDFTPRCKELLAIPVARIFPDALVPDRKEDALEKFNDLKDKLDEQALMGNKLATECRLIVDNLMKQLREDNMEGFSDSLKKLLL
jgi:hypothetical protein